MIYSHSRLSTFEQCPYKFKLKYIDKVEPEEKHTIETFLGTRVHETLEKLYKDLLFQKENSLDDLYGHLHQQWAENWDDTIRIVKDQYKEENYLKMAERYLKDYYETYYPFHQERTIALEHRVQIALDDDGEYKLQGFIDRLAERKTGFYEIHDYKTNMRLPLPEYIKSDRQLALYAIGVKNQYPDVRDVRLIWHFLAFNKEIDSTRTDEELDQLKKETIQLIDSIEAEETYQTTPSYLCEWCEFKPICRQWSHLYQLREKPQNEYMSDAGKNLVDRYAALKMKTQQIHLDMYAELEKIEEAIISFAEKENIDVVYGSENKVRIKTEIRYTIPQKGSSERKKLEQRLIEIGKWHDVVQFDARALNRILLEHKLKDNETEYIQSVVTLEKSKRLYLSKIKIET